MRTPWWALLDRGDRPPQAAKMVPAAIRSLQAGELRVVKLQQLRR